MKFGFESEKIIYDLKDRKVSSTALRTLVALEDYKFIYGDEDVNRLTGEFVHNMIEMSSRPTTSVFEVARDYLFSYELVREVAHRTQKRLLPIGSYPLSFTPTMVSKWQYYVQNAILSNNADVGWSLDPSHGLYAASNCAGVHIHAEIDTLPEHLSLSSELANKHNLAVALIPLAAFASSPYFDGHHEAVSMRTKKYYFGVYGKFPEFGGIPPIVEHSQDLLKHYLTSMQSWKAKGIALGLDPDEIHRLATKHGANWGMVRWNRKWNTVEMRCFDTDLVGMDVAKFTIASRALKRLDLQGEHLFTRILRKEHAFETPLQPEKLDAMLAELMPELFEVSGGEVGILPTPLMNRMIELALVEGLSHELVSEYVGRLLRFASKEFDRRERWLAQAVFDAYAKKESTAEWLLKLANRKKTLRKEDAELMIDELLKREDEQFEAIANRLPEELQPPKNHPFPSGKPAS